MKRSRSGFTLVELVVVIAVIGILASIVIASYTGVQANNRDTRRKTDMANLVKSLELYYSDYGNYPLATSWYSSDNANWSTFSGMLDISKSPIDPRNTGSPTTAGNYGYAYYSGASCGKQPGQWFILVYRFESAPKEKITDGTCSTNDGDTYYSAGASYNRVVR